MYRAYLEGMGAVKMKKGQAERNPALGEGKMGHMFVWLTPKALGCLHRVNPLRPCDPATIPWLVSASSCYNYGSLMY